MQTSPGKVFHEEQACQPIIQKWQAQFPYPQARAEAYEKLAAALTSENSLLDALKQICATPALRSLRPSMPVVLRVLENFSALYAFEQTNPERGYFNIYLPHNYVGNNTMETLRLGGDLYMQDDSRSGKTLIRLFAANLIDGAEPDIAKIAKLTSALNKLAEGLSAARIVDDREFKGR